MGGHLHNVDEHKANKKRSIAHFTKIFGNQRIKELKDKFGSKIDDLTDSCFISMFGQKKLDELLNECKKTSNHTNSFTNTLSRIPKKDRIRKIPFLHQKITSSTNLSVQNRNMYLNQVKKQNYINKKLKRRKKDLSI